MTLGTVPTMPPISVDHKIVRKQARDLQADLLFDFSRLAVDGWTTLVEPLREGLPALIAEVEVPGVPLATYRNLLRRNAFLDLQAQFTERFPEVMSTIEASLKTLIVNSGVAGQKYGQNLLQLYTSESFKGMIKKDLADIVLKEYGARIVPHLRDDVYTKAWSGLSKEMITNMRKGLPPETIAKYAVDHGMSKGLNHILLVARDQSLRAFREADLEFFRSTNKVIGYQRTASHDGHVCMLCLSLDGKVYKKNETPELHAQDRCDFLPILEGQEPYEWTKGDAWLRSQSEQRQKDILGPARFKLFKEGKPLSAFSTVTTHPVWGPTLKEVPLSQLGVMPKRLVAPPFSSSPLPTVPPALSSPLQVSLKDQLAHNAYTLDDEADRMRGVFVSERVKIEGDGYAIRKPEGGEGPRTAHNKARREAVAYDIDQKFGINLTPTTVYRATDDASYQQFIANANPAARMKGASVKDGIVYYDVKDPEEFGRLSFLDGILGNTDRHSGNFLITNDGHLVAIDHGLSISQQAYAKPDRYISRAVSHAAEFSGWHDKADKIPLSPLYRERLRESLEDGSLRDIITEGIGPDVLDVFGDDSKVVSEALERAKRMVDDWDEFYVDPTGSIP